MVDNTSDQKNYTVQLPSISDDHLKCAKILLNSAFKIKNINRIIDKGLDNLQWLKEIMKHHNLYSAKNFKYFAKEFDKKNKPDFFKVYNDNMKEYGTSFQEQSINKDVSISGDVYNDENF